MKYYLNNLGTPIFLDDIRKAIEYDPAFPDRPTRLSQSEIERSAKLKQYLLDRLVIDVTEEYLEEGYSPQYNQVVEAPQSQAVGDTHHVGGVARPRPQVMPRINKIMVDEAEGSRITGASDAHLHTAHLSKGLRQGAETSILADSYDTPEQRAASDRSRSSFLVENDSRATPAVDPRMLRTGQVQMTPNVTPDARFREQAPVPHVPAPGQVNGGSINIQQGPPLAQLYQTRPVAQRMASYTTHEHGAAHKNDPNWGAHSQLLAGRRAANPIQARPHDHAFANHHSEALDPRMEANQQRVLDPGLNPALASIYGGPAEDPNVNPLFAFVASPPAHQNISITEVPVVEGTGYDLSTYTAPEASQPTLNPILSGAAPKVVVAGPVDDKSDEEGSEELVPAGVGAEEAPRGRGSRKGPKVTAAKRGGKKK